VRRDRRLFDSNGNEVLINLICTACGKSKPFSEFGARLVNGQMRSIPQCTSCRGRYYQARPRFEVQPQPIPDCGGL
jgi:ribosomal protein L33